MSVAETYPELEFARRHFGGEVICGTCGATFETMNDRCCAPLEYKCPGYMRCAEAVALFKRLH